MRGTKSSFRPEPQAVRVPKIGQPAHVKYSYKLKCSQSTLGQTWHSPRKWSSDLRYDGRLGGQRLFQNGDPDAVGNVLAILNIRELDTVRVHNGGKSEELLGACNASKDIAISTKAPGFSPGSLSKPNIISSCNASLKMDIFYFRGPDRQAPFEEQCRLVCMLGSNGIGALYGVMTKWRMNLHFRGVVFYQVCIPSDTAILAEILPT